MFKLALLGKPVKHSLSPVLHREFASQFGLQLNYVLLETEIYSLPKRLEQLSIEGYTGVNLTTPLKDLSQLSCPLLLDKKYSFYNVLAWRKEEIVATNTDGLGFANSLDSLPLSLIDQQVLLLGFGATGSTILPYILDRKPSRIIILVRDKSKLKCRISPYLLSNRVKFLDYAESFSMQECFSLVINASSAGMQGVYPTVNQQWLKKAVCYDLSYGKFAKPFLTFALNSGASMVLDGMDMLIEQGAESFKVWFGVKPNTGLIKASKTKLFPPTYM